MSVLGCSLLRVGFRCMKSKLLQLIWFAAFLFGLIVEFSYSFAEELSIILPAIYLTLSFVVFSKFSIGYRIFHHFCMTSLCLYFILGLVIELPKILSRSGIGEHLAYLWFSSLSSTYLVFLIIFAMAYLPYFAWKKFNAI